jgi:GxxExxY protein
MKYLNRNGTNGAEDDPLTSKVIGIAIEIYKALGTEFLESIHYRALKNELAEVGLFFASEAPLAVKYKDHVLGTFAADMIVENRLLFELKAMEVLSLGSEIQDVNYPKASNIDAGLILNFGTAPLQIKRKYRNRPAPDLDLRLHEV